MSDSVLIIEDTPVNMKLATMLLQREGHRVLQANDALEGLALARAHLPCLILMDIQLPGIDGLAATRVLKADPATAAIPVLALTAFAMTGDEARIRAAGCDGYIAKPIDYRVFLEQVRRTLSAVAPRPGAEPESRHAG
jgi:two-component system, cell cycle response regulator DivK